MTDGIVQKAFGEYRDGNFNLAELERRIIERIKQLEPKYYSTILNKPHPIISELIGDNL